MTSYKVYTLSRFSNIYGSFNGYFPISNSTPGHIFVPDKPNSVPDTSNSVPDTFVLDEAQRHIELQKPDISENTKHSCPWQNSYPWYNLAYLWYNPPYPWYNLVVPLVQSLVPLVQSLIPWMIHQPAVLDASPYNR